MIAWTIEAARSANRLSSVIVSTDDREIADVAKAFGAEVPFERPSALATAEVHASRVVTHVLDHLDEAVDAVVMLLPTSPLRTYTDINACLDLLDRSEEGAVVSVVKLPYCLTQLRTLEREFVRPVVPTENYNTQRQDAEPLYVANGAIFASTTTLFRGLETFHHEKTRAYIMPPERSIDIDTMFDLEVARFLLDRRLSGAIGLET